MFLSSVLFVVSLSVWCLPCLSVYPPSSPTIPSNLLSVSVPLSLCVRLSLCLSTHPYPSTFVDVFPLSVNPSQYLSSVSDRFSTPCLGLSRGLSPILVCVVESLYFPVSLTNSVSLRTSLSSFLRLSPSKSVSPDPCRPLVHVPIIGPIRSVWSPSVGSVLSWDLEPPGVSLRPSRKHRPTPYT